MSDKALTDEQWRQANFMEALRRMPRPVPMYDNCVICPWCGAPHYTVTFGGNGCIECTKPFVFGDPPWPTEVDRLMTWVPFPHREWEGVGEKAHLFPDWKPNDRLRDVYDYWDRYKKDADMDKRATHESGQALN